MTDRMRNDFDQLVERYLGLESLEVIEVLLDLCGAIIDQRALPLLKQRLQEEQVQLPKLRAQGYIRLGEKSEQMVAALTQLIAALSRVEGEEETR